MEQKTSNRKLTTIKPEDLPYLSHVPASPRCIVVTTYYDVEKEELFTYVRRSDGQLVVMRTLDMRDGTYIARAPIDSELDVPLPFSEIVLQHFSLDSSFDALRDIEQDLVNALSSLHKYFILLWYANHFKDASFDRVLNSEIEYSFANHRSFYDCIHRVIQTVYETYADRPKKLPDSFRRIVDKTESVIRTKYRFPTPLIRFYKSREGVFRTLREIRDNIFHHGQTIRTVSIFPDGFGLSVDEKLLKKLGDLNLWPEELLKLNRIGSLLAVLEYITRDMFDAMQLLGDSLLNSFENPPKAIATGHAVYFRSSLAKHLASLKEYRSTHWFNVNAVLRIGRDNSFSLGAP